MARYDLQSSKNVSTRHLMDLRKRQARQKMWRVVHLITFVNKLRKLTTDGK